MDPFHQQLARIAFAASEDLGLVLAGGYAISAHQLTSRPSRDLDFATVSTLPLDVITDRLSDVYRAAGYDVQVIESAPTMARFEVHDGNQRCEIDLLKAGIQPPVRLGIGPVLALDDAVGLKVGALHDRGTHRDFIDVHAAHTRGGYSLHELERLGAAHLSRFTPRELLDRLESVEFLDDETFTSYGLTDDDVTALHHWSRSWAGDIRTRIVTDDDMSLPAEPDPDWDSYLDD
ncbi:nucleotidyl transferase AbiEii/AbiGii toxin family protein [Paractinoplanes durhamensis]|uniref:Nucleotidyl transferase AbiEii/AbiGii toxin family protein n=1 Tax=Paractinoplanes durhamensis TaxID=113563 RepID=A0ABQ3YXT2_9ACTN|nr:nucleotidyl transferase AbiEii/AbiGii toxin family protein [Actinoplanes durhamensis]GIE02383.1 hypothetical protein Adu01nite_37330 [Actinoplanes durhamensis]